MLEKFLTQYIRSTFWNKHIAIVLFITALLWMGELGVMRNSMHNVRTRLKNFSSKDNSSIYTYVKICSVILKECIQIQNLSETVWGGVITVMLQMLCVCADCFVCTVQYIYNIPRDNIFKAAVYKVHWPELSQTMNRSPYLH